MTKIEGNSNNETGTFKIPSCSKDDIEVVATETGTNYPGETERTIKSLCFDTGTTINTGALYTEHSGLCDGTSKVKSETSEGTKKGVLSTPNGDNDKSAIAREFDHKSAPPGTENLNADPRVKDTEEKNGPILPMAEPHGVL